MTNARHHIATHPTLKATLSWTPDDSTLSSGEAALARIVHTLADNIDSLDGRQLAAVTAWVTAVTNTSLEAEAAGRGQVHGSGVSSFQ